MSRAAVFALPGTLLICWVLLNGLGIIDPLFLPSPWAVAVSVWEGTIDGQLLRDTAATFLRSIAGFLISAIIGIPLGLIIGRHPAIARSTQPTIDFFRSIPATALFPLFLFFFGISEEAKVAIVVYACSLVVLVNTAYGAQQVKSARITSARVMGASSFDVFRTIVVPESAPGIFAGLRIALSMAFVLIVVTEMFIGTNVGLGHRIMESQMVYRAADMYTGILATGILGYAANWILLTIEHQRLHWVGR